MIWFFVGFLIVTNIMTLLWIKDINFATKTHKYLINGIMSREKNSYDLIEKLINKVNK